MHDPQSHNAESPAVAGDSVEADERTRTADPFITRDRLSSQPVTSGPTEAPQATPEEALEDPDRPTERPQDAPTGGEVMPGGHGWRKPVAPPAEHSRPAGLPPAPSAAWTEGDAWVRGFVPIAQLKQAQEQIDHLRDEVAGTQDLRDDLAATKQQARYRELSSTAGGKRTARAVLNTGLELLGAYIGTFHPAHHGEGVDGAIARIDVADRGKLRSLTSVVQAAAFAVDALEDHARWSAATTLYGEALQARLDAFLAAAENGPPEAGDQALADLRSIADDLVQGRDYPQVAA